MIGDITRWLEARLKAETYAPQKDANELRLVSAALLVEAARADHHFSDEERESLADLLRARHGLSEPDAQELLAHARARSARSVSLTDLTQVVKKYTDADQRKALVTDMWRIALADGRIALADGRIDKYEEYVIRQVAGLLYVPHADYIHARETARNS